MSEPAFDSTLFAKKDGPMNQYRIYKTPAEFVTVEANSALEAIKTSGCDQIVRVERDSLMYLPVLDPKLALEVLLKKEEAPAAEAAAAPGAETAPAAEAPAEAQAPAEEAPKEA